jgi:hypothetical protein
MNKHRQIQFTAAERQALMALVLTGLIVALWLSTR